MKTIDEMPRIMLKCDCYSESLEVIYDKEYKEFDFALWTNGHPSYGWWWRIKYIWKILKTGEPYGDQVCLDVPKAKKLAKFIQAQLKNKPKIVTFSSH